LIEPFPRSERLFLPPAQMRPELGGFAPARGRSSHVACSAGAKSSQSICAQLSVKIRHAFFTEHGKDNALFGKNSAGRDQNTRARLIGQRGYNMGGSPSSCCVYG
jgi:hypothetical protein